MWHVIQSRPLLVIVGCVETLNPFTYALVHIYNTFTAWSCPTQHLSSCLCHSVTLRAPGQLFLRDNQPTCICYHLWNLEKLQVYALQDTIQQSHLVHFIWKCSMQDNYCRTLSVVYHIWRLGKLFSAPLFITFKKSVGTKWPTINYWAHYLFSWIV